MIKLFLFLWATAAAAAPVVFVTLPPQRWLVQELAGDLVVVEVMVRPGQSPHTFEPTGRQIAQLARARGWLTIGMLFEQKLLQKAKGSLPGLHEYPIQSGIARLTTAGAVDGHHHAEGDCHDDGSDPHLWLGTGEMTALATNACRALQQLMPAANDLLETRLADLTCRIGRLHEELATELSPYRGRSFWVYHPSWGYFARSYGLIQVAVEEAGREPAPRQLSALVARAALEKVRVLYGDPQLDPRRLRVLADQLGAQVEMLDPLAEEWEANMRRVAQKLVQGMQEPQADAQRLTRGGRGE